MRDADRCASPLARRDDEPAVVQFAGDWHGETGHALRAIDHSPVGDNGTRLVVQLGDFGIWPGQQSARYPDKLSARLVRRNAICLFIDGNHEAFPRLSRYPLRADGLREIRPRLFHLPRGTRWIWHGVRFLALGGPTILDRPNRREGVDWWPDETLTPDQVAHAIAGGPCDVMLTHDAPAGVDVPLPEPAATWSDVELRRADWHRRVVRQVVDAVRPRYLFHGHSHSRYDAPLRLDDGHVVSVVGLADGTAGPDNWLNVSLSLLRLSEGVAFATRQDIATIVPLKNTTGRRTEALLDKTRARGSMPPHAAELIVAKGGPSPREIQRLAHAAWTTAVGTIDQAAIEAARHSLHARGSE